MKEKDLNKIAKLEKSIKDKYGDQAIQNPKQTWTAEKEKKYLEDLKKFYKGDSKGREYDEQPGFVLLEKFKADELESNRTCPECGSYSTHEKDDLYMTKFECCFECYVKYVEHREERWNSGWRPNT